MSTKSVNGQQPFGKNLRYASFWRDLGLLSLTICALAGLAGCASGPVESEPIVQKGEGSDAPSVNVTRWQAWRDAEAVAAAAPGRFAVIGTGDSMQPVYGDRTVLVLQQVEFDRLQAGMQVAYRNRAGRMVVHRLVSREPGGWRAIGLNNTIPDEERVTEVNLIGVVYASFANDSVR